MEVGIDFGTTFSTIAFSSEGAKGCLPLNGSIFIETQVFVYESSNLISIGKEAGKALRDGANGRLYVNPKRWVGVSATNVEDYKRRLKPEYIVTVDQTGRVLLGGIGRGQNRFLSVTDIIVLFLRAMITEVEQFTSTRVSGAVVTVPAEYNSYKRAFIVSALRSLGIPVRSIINEPTAAAIYGLANSDQDDVLVSVFDFGGGTFDASFVRKKGDATGVIYSVGDNFLGGRDIDRAIADDLQNKYPGQLDMTRLFLYASAIKEDLSNDASIEEHLIGGRSGPITVKFTRADLDAIVKPFAERARKIYEEGAKKFSPDTSIAIMTGGSSALQVVRDTIAASRYIKSVIFNKDDFRCSVALGAKIRSDILMNKSQMQLVDSLTNTLSDEVVGFRPIVIFPKGSPIPATYTTTFTVPAGPIGYGIYEGEAVRSFLNELTFKTVYSKPTAGKGIVTVKYDLSIDGTLAITIDGNPQRNLFTPPEVSTDINNYRYTSKQVENLGLSLSEYEKQFNNLYTQSITETDIRNNSGPFKEKEIVANYDRLFS